MPKCLITYFSQHGSTGRVAQQIGDGLALAGYQVDLCNLKNEQPPMLIGYDLFGVGSPVYYFRVPFNVAAYLTALPRLDGLPTFAFLTHGTYRCGAGNDLRRALARKGAREVGYFSCHGSDYFLGYLKQGYWFSPEHPTAQELAMAESFGREVATRVDGREHGRPMDAMGSMIYWLEKLVTRKWLATQLYSRWFRVDSRKCNGCGRCVDQCPTGNISKGDGGRPAWGRNCLLCLACEAFCPREAITSPMSWPVFRPFMTYNVRHARQDPALSHARVILSAGRIKPS